MRVRLARPTGLGQTRRRFRTKHFVPGPFPLYIAGTGRREHRVRQAPCGRGGIGRRSGLKILRVKRGGVAELADALDSKSSVRKDLPVRPRSPLPKLLSCQVRSSTVSAPLRLTHRRSAAIALRVGFLTVRTPRSRSHASLTPPGPSGCVRHVPCCPQFSRARTWDGSSASLPSCSPDARARNTRGRTRPHAFLEIPSQGRRGAVGHVGGIEAPGDGGTTEP